MRKKINTGLVATNGDGKPSVRPPIPAGWCRSTSVTSGGSDQEEAKLNGTDFHKITRMSSENGSVEPMSQENGPDPALNGTGATTNDPEGSTNHDALDDSADPGNSNSVDTNEPQCEASPIVDNTPQTLPSINNPNTVLSEDSNVDVESEEQSAPLSADVQDGPVETVSNVEVVSSAAEGDQSEQDEDSALSADAQYIEKQVVESFLNANSSELASVDARNEGGVPDNAGSSTNNQQYTPNESQEQVPTSSAESLASTSTAVTSNSKEKIMDAVSMTIASVAAGEGDVQELVSRRSLDRQRDDRSYQHAHSSGGKQKKSKSEKSMPASARLPVISSLLAPSSAASHSTLPGIQHIASAGKTSSSPTTVLPSVAHFLGPAKSPPMTYNPHQAGADMYGTGVQQSSGSESSESMHPNAQYHSPSGGHMGSSSKSKNSRKPVTPAGLRLSMAASEELPDPLPLPQYSDKVIRAKQLGTVAFDRPTVLRETVQFFLQYKHYWSSHDYDRISNLVIELFPEFKDNSDSPGVPANKRIRTDLSMYARNFRRREVSQRKKEGGGTTPTNMDQKELAPTSTPETAVKSFLHSSASVSGGGGPTVLGNSSNATDFCNELLTAASIIESQNTAGGARNGDLSSQLSHNHHKVKIAEPGSHDQGVVVQKQEAMEEDDGRGGVSGNHHRSQGEAVDDDEDDTPIHFVYDKDTMAAAATRDANTAWQMYSDQMAQAMATGNSTMEYGMGEQAIKKDLGTCARNMRRRLPAAKYKPTATAQKGWTNSQAGLDTQMPEAGGQSSSMAPGTTEYMKALMAAQNINLTELGMTQRNLGELAMLAGLKQRIEQHPQEVTDLERQYLAQCSSEEQRQALMASGAFGNDSAAMAALSAFYGQLGMDITGGTKRGMSSSGDYNASTTHEGSSSTTAAADLDVPNKRQRRISQAEVEKRLREAELNHNSVLHEDSKSHGLTVGVSDKNLVKREPMSPSGPEGLKTSSKQQLSVPNPISMPMYPTTSSSSAHEQAYWDAQAAANMALMGVATMAHSAPQQTATQAHSQAQIQHLPGHDPSANLTSTEAPMNLTYHESDKHATQSHRLNTDSPLPESLPDTAGLAAQVEVTTSSAKSHSPRRRASSSPRSAQQGDQSLTSRDQVWFPHGAGFKKENQEIVCLPEPLPIPAYSQKIVAARDEGASMRHRSEIIRETARFFLGLKYWWSSADYTRISELVVQQFPDLKDDSSTDGMTSYRRIQRDLSMCARNLRRSKKPRKMRELSTDPSNTLLDVPETPRPSKKSKSSKSGSAFSSSSDKKLKRASGSSSSSSKAKKAKHEAAAAVVSEPSATPGVSEDMTAAAALLQQQFMQSSTASTYHPSAHLLPSSHLLPSLHTHPALHDQQMQSQLSSALMQQQQQQPQQHQHHHIQEGHNISVEEAHNAKRLVKEESASQEEMSHHHSGVKSSAVAPMQRTSTPTESSMAKASHGHMRGMDGTAVNKDEHEKLIQPPAPPANTMKVYVDPDHGSDLQERFSTLWRKGKFFDASLGVANKKLHVHKLVLLAMSPYLQETFKNADPRSQLEVNLPSDTTYETAKAFLKYIYEGILEVDTSSVRSLHKIATMLQMTKLAQYCQNFAQQLQEEADQANGHLQRLGDSNTISSSDIHRATSTRYMPDEHGHMKADYLPTADQNSTEQAGGPSSHFLHQDVLAQHRALVAASSSVQPTHPSSLLLSSSQDATQQLIQAALARHQTSSSPPPPSSSASSSMYQHHQQQVLAAQTDANAALLHRLTSPDSSVTASGATSLDHQQRLALAAYWQAHQLGELMSRNPVTGLTSDPSNLTSSSELAAIAAAAGTTSEDARNLLSNLGHDIKFKSSVHSRGHHSKETWSSQTDADNGHQATMLPETCIPADMGRTHVTNAEGNS